MGECTPLMFKLEFWRNSRLDIMSIGETEGIPSLQSGFSILKFPIQSYPYTSSNAIDA